LDRPSKLDDTISIIHPPDGQTVRGESVEVVGWVRGVPRESGEARVVLTVNGQLFCSAGVVPQARSPFRQEVPLRQGTNEIQLELLVGTRLVEQKKVVVKAQGPKQPLTYQALYKNSWALLIGIDNYPSMQRLKYAIRDAKSLEEFLKTRSYFDRNKIFTLYDREATKERILELMNDFMGANPALTTDDRVLVFFAGHGQRRRVRKGHRKSDYRGYLIPYDGDLDRMHSTCISVEEIKEAASVLCAKHTLFILDCCFSGMAGLRPRAAISPKPLSVALSDPCVRILTAGKSDEEVFEGKKEWGGNSLFTRYLLKGLEGFADHDGDGLITSDDLYFYVRDRVVEESKNRQTPQSRHLVEYGEGQFVFFVRKDVPAGKQARERQEPVENKLAKRSSAPIEVLEPRRPKPPIAEPKMLRIAANEFEMGSEDALDESPIHHVHLSAFQIDQFLVSNRMYKEFLDKTGYDGSQEADENYLADWVQGSYPKGQDDYPVTWVSWFNAIAYCRFRGCRLPTEAEWEMAARGGLKRARFPWGDQLPDQLRRRPKSAKRKMQLGILPPNGFGLYDISGNVSQWCMDWYDAHYYKRSPDTNPKGPSNGKYRVVRGGSFLTGQRILRCSARLFADPKSTSATIGFRCARGDDQR